MKKGISLVGISSRPVIESILERYKDVWFELPYTMKRAFWDTNKDLLKNRIVSIHSLSPAREYFPNLAAEDEKALTFSFAEVKKDAEFASALSARFLILHPGYLMPGLVPSSSSKRLKGLERAELEGFRLCQGSTICSRRYPEGNLYRNAFDKMKKNLEILSLSLQEKGITLCAENLNPRIGYMLMLPEEMEELGKIPSVSFCLDIGHLRVSSALFGFDFLSAIRKILGTGKVRTTHLHSNPSKDGIYKDSHESLYKYECPYKEVLGMIEESGANMILESVEEPLENLDILFSSTSRQSFISPSSLQAGLSL